MIQGKENIPDNKRIAKNSLILYFRMFVIIIVSLYTNRVVLSTLGITDYGIYNLVGGIILIAEFLNTAMIAATQRYLSFELEKSNLKKLSKVFSTSVNIHLAICAISFLLAETIGLWFVNTKLNIPVDRMIAANWVYQASIVTFIFNVMSIPYYSAIVAHEEMSPYAYFSLLYAVLKLLIASILIFFSYDKLVIYSILMVCVIVFIRLCYTLYCKRHYEECVYHFTFDKSLFKEMFSFTGWSIIGNFGYSLKDQISNIVLNLFYGATLNAARGVSIQVSGAIRTFAMNVTVALNPQITKQYAIGNVEESRKLVYVGSRYSFYMLMLVSLPIIININYLLDLWLVEVPKYTSQFVIFAIFASLIDSMSECVSKAILATGRIKWFQIGISILLLTEIPCVWILMDMGFPPYAVMWPALLTCFVAMFFRFWLISRYVRGYYIRDFIFQVILRCSAVIIVSFCFCYFICKSFHETFSSLILSTLICTLISMIVILLFGMYHNERAFVIRKIKMILYNRIV